MLTTFKLLWCPLGTFEPAVHCPLAAVVGTRCWCCALPPGGHPSAKSVQQFRFSGHTSSGNRIWRISFGGGAGFVGCTDIAATEDIWDVFSLLVSANYYLWLLIICLHNNRREGRKYPVCKCTLYMCISFHISLKVILANIIYFNRTFESKCISKLFLICYAIVKHW